MNIYNADELKKTNRKNINALGKGAENMKAKKSRTAKTYTTNIERKRILKHRREQTLQMQKTENQQRNISLQLQKLAIKPIGPQKIHKRAEKATIGR